MRRRLRRSQTYILCFVLGFPGLAGSARADDGDDNIISYRCDTAQDRIVATSDQPLPGDRNGINSWHTDDLVKMNKDGTSGTTTSIKKDCKLSGGNYEVTVSPDAVTDVQGQCGAAPNVGAISISRAGKTVVDEQFDNTCFDPSSKAISRVTFDGKTGKKTLVYKQN